MNFVHFRFETDNRRNVRPESKNSSALERRHEVIVTPTTKSLAPGILVLPQGLSENVRSKDVPNNPHQSRGYLSF